MSKKGELLREIASLGEQIQRHWADLGRAHLTTTEQAEVRRHIQQYTKTVRELLGRLKIKAPQYG